MDATPNPNNTDNDQNKSKGDELNPAQKKVLKLLGKRLKDRPEFSPELADRLHQTIEQGLEPLLPITPTQGVYISKGTLGQVLACEGYFLAQGEAPFEYSIPTTRGVVSHKAVELSVHWPGEPLPMPLVDAAFERLEVKENKLSHYLESIRRDKPAEWSELRSVCNDHIAQFLECFPPLKEKWRPRTESGLRMEAHDGKFVFSGKVDLALGIAKGNRAGTVIVDFKTGWAQTQHLDDLRFYALIETLRIGVPPRLVANYYLDQGKIVEEEVTEGVLNAATLRLIDGTTKVVEVLGKVREPVLTAGYQCKWCPALHDCEVGKKHLANDDEDGTGC